MLTEQERKIADEVWMRAARHSSINDSIYAACAAVRDYALAQVAEHMPHCPACAILNQSLEHGEGTHREGTVEHPKHDYISTACHHGLHERCRRECKFCGAACQCACGHPVTRQEQALQDAQPQEQADDELVKRIQYAIAKAYRDVKDASSIHAAEAACAVLRIALEDCGLARLEDMEKAVRDELQRRGYAPWDEVAFAVCSRLTALTARTTEERVTIETYREGTIIGVCLDGQEQARWDMHEAGKAAIYAKGLLADLKEGGRP